VWLIHRLLRVPPDLSQSTQSIFYPATVPALSTMLLYGQEYTLLLFYILLYSIVDVTGGNTPVAILVTFLVHLLVENTRLWLGQRNIANKTLVDNRFLL
jgi:meckelin